MTYVISDIHGRYNEYMEMLARIGFSDADALYINGDILDRGPEPIRIVQDVMERPNVICIAGNHELMGIRCLKWLKDGTFRMDYGVLGDMMLWAENGGGTTVEEFQKLDGAEKDRVFEYLAELEFYKELTVNGEKYLLVHGGLERFEPDKPLDDYDPEDMVWTRTDYGVPYFPDRYVVTGHTPTSFIAENPRPGCIFRGNRHIAIDCGAGAGVRLGCICLETGEEFYVECGK